MTWTLDDEAIADAFAVETVASRAAWLDGGPTHGSLFATEPDAEVVTADLSGLDEVEGRWRAQPDRVWIGWLTYDVGAAAVMGRVPRAGRLHGLCLRRYPAALQRTGGLTRGHGDDTAVEALQRRLQAASAGPPPHWPFDPLRHGWSVDAYRQRVRRALGHIVAGDTYQVNLSHPMHGGWAPGHRGGLRWHVLGAYRELRARAPASMGALLEVDGGFIMSNSPETLLDVRLDPGGDVARSWPIKGTTARGGSPAADLEARAALQRSEKDAAEHVMIVDLVRNDLGQVATAGSVHASPTPSVLTLPTVHHLETEVRATLRRGWRLRELVKAVFPGGSITGAPKRRSIEIIDDLEQAPREIYCGAIVVLEPTGLRLSIPIRTAWVDPDGLHLRSGGGIVADSDPDAEWAETLAKARAFDP